LADVGREDNQNYGSLVQMPGRVADLFGVNNLLHGARVGNLRSYYTGYFWHNFVVVNIYSLLLQMICLSVLICTLIHVAECLFGDEVRQQMNYLDTISLGQRSLFNEAIHALDVNFASPLLVSVLSVT